MWRFNGYDFMDINLSYRCYIFKANRSNITIREAFSQRNLWKGIHVCLLRAMIVNAVNFKIYETVMNSKHLSFLDE